jgi:hypothetical protein
MTRLTALLLTAPLLAAVAACSSEPATPELIDLDIGCPSATYPSWETSPYVLPYPVGETYQVDLSHCSGSYHSQGLPDAFAIDFAMNVGTHITASRAGTVVHAEESGIDYDFPNNVVVVDHGDDTYGAYMHLTENGALVEVGEMVVPGDTLGLSGVTGLAGYPHLHFVVIEDDWTAWPYVSTPTTFSNTSANPRSLRSGRVYVAQPY